jgi:hypothetical protein
MAAGARLGRLLGTALLAGCGLVLTPASAGAQWYVAGFAGANTTQPATITVDQPSRQTHLVFTDVHFTSESFTSPQYYGYRIGRMFGQRRRWGLEFEFTHPKVFGATAGIVRIQGQWRGAPIDTTAPMRTFVDRYAMSHGLNLALVNVVLRLPIGGGPSPAAAPLALILRAGAGPTIPHHETTIGGDSLDGYEVSNVGVQAAVGLSVRLRGRLGATVDYKFARTSPLIDVVDGTGRTTARIHQIAVGLSIGLTR